MIRLQNKFLFYDGEVYDSNLDFICIDLVNMENDDRKFFIDEKELTRDKDKLYFKNEDNCSTFFVSCKDKNGRFMWKTNAIMVNYSDKSNMKNIDVNEELKRIESMFNAEAVKLEIEKMKEEIQNVKFDDMPTREELNGIVENFNIFVKNISDKIEKTERAMESYKNGIDICINTYSNGMVEKISEISQKVDRIKIPESPFDLDLGEHDVPAGYFVSFENGKVEKYSFCSREPFGVSLPNKKIRVKGACDVRHDGVDIKIGRIVMGDKNGVASKYSKGYPVVKIKDASHCTIIL